MTRLDRQPWMTAPATQRLMAALGEARFVGGAVRNTLLGRKVDDIDIATPLLPGEVEHRLKAAGIQAVHTGIEHGTITAVVEGKPFEVTTLRRDVETDGRHAVVAFTTDWKLDAQRRDFTMNALYAASDGEVFDFVGGVDDLKAGRVRFVGDAVRRIREDYLRILRLFRFHAWYGAGEIDRDALAASTTAEAIEGFVRNVSGERIRNEMFKLLAAPSPVSVLKIMDDKKVLDSFLNEDRNFERLQVLTEIDAANRFEPDPLLRLVALLRSLDDAKYVAEEWSLSRAQAARIESVVIANARIVPDLPIHEVHRLLYRHHRLYFKDQLFLKWAEEPDAEGWPALLNEVVKWQRPRFPLTGADVMRAGVPEGPKVGRVLAKVEDWWIENGFPQDHALLAEQLKQAVKAQ